MAVAATLPQTKSACVMDREADFFDLVDTWREDPRTELLVRADHDRCTMEDRKLFAAVNESEPQMQFSLRVKRQTYYDNFPARKAFGLQHSLPGRRNSDQSTPKPRRSISAATSTITGMKTLRTRVLERRGRVAAPASAPHSTPSATGAAVSGWMSPRWK